MSLPEFLYRIRTALKKKKDKRTKIGYLPKGTIDHLPKSLLFPPKEIKVVEPIDYSIFGNTLNYQNPINWHYDISNEKQFPKDFSFDIDTRSGKNGNVKIVWEINRLQYLTHICLKFIQTGELRYLEQFIEIIESWKKANPYLEGVNWYSNIEVNIRIINWVTCWEILNVNNLIAQNYSFKLFVETTWLPLIELHAQHAYRYESKYSSSNNHLIAEASGLFIAGCYWSFQDSPKWIKKGQRILESEIIKQHSENGINKEEASEYIQFITDFFMLALLIGERSGNGFSTKYHETLEKVFLYIHHMMDMSGNVPYYGDDDDGKVLSLNIDVYNDNFKSLLTTGAILFKNPILKRTGNIFDLKNRVLFGYEGEQIYNTLATEEVNTETKLYENEGHFLIKKRNGESEIYLHVDIAPLGYLSIAAHGHADALSFFLNIDGKPYIVDPGTYTYHSFPEWRAYFKGTLAHNTIRVDGIDQAINGGPCLWINHYTSKVLEVKDTAKETLLRGSHNGYEKIGVQHTRTYRFNKLENSITIHDKLNTQDNQIHSYEYPLHFHPEIVLKQLSVGKFSISHPEKRSVVIELDKRLTPSVVKGAENPLLGWFSPSFLQKQPTSVLYSKLEIKGNIELETTIYLP
ncbi:heparinase II/III family protein [Zobellia sp.]|nr:heparinase II/III family protein [Zobellia sp.]